MNNKEISSQKKIVLVNDFTGFGRCSIAVQMPVISAMKVQCCPIPTSILSNHTGYDSFFFDDYTEKMEHYVNEWKKLNLSFDGICTGFLGSEKQIKIVSDILAYFKNDKNVTIIDPVMGDNGKVYHTYNQKMCMKMKELIKFADIVTPNLTESCILADTEYHEIWTKKELEKLAFNISSQGPSKVVITGIDQGKYISNFCYEKDKESYFVKSLKAGRSRPGTGDLFVSIIAADAVNGVEFKESVKKASNFVKKCIVRTEQMNIPINDGVCFEELLANLCIK